MPPITVYLSPEEAATMLRVSPRTIRRLCDQGSYPNLKQVGRQYRIPAEDLGITNEQARAYIERTEKLHA